MVTPLIVNGYVSHNGSVTFVPTGRMSTPPSPVHGWRWSKRPVGYLGRDTVGIRGACERTIHVANEVCAGGAHWGDDASHGRLMAFLAAKVESSSHSRPMPFF